MAGGISKVPLFGVRLERQIPLHSLRDNKHIELGVVLEEAGLDDLLENRSANLDVFARHWLGDLTLAEEKHPSSVFGQEHFLLQILSGLGQWRFSHQFIQSCPDLFRRRRPDERFDTSQHDRHL